MRHVHNIVYDRWENCLWIFTGDNGDECRILRASVRSEDDGDRDVGKPAGAAVAAVVTAEGVYFASDTPLEANHVYRLSRDGSSVSRWPIWIVPASKDAWRRRR